MSLVNKLLQSDTDRIKLDRLKVLDVSYNNEHRYDSLRMPDLSKLSQLTDLVEVNISTPGGVMYDAPAPYGQSETYWTN